MAFKLYLKGEALALTKHRRTRMRKMRLKWLDPSTVWVGRSGVWQARSAAKSAGSGDSVIHP